jgi:hypothetical protein
MSGDLARSGTFFLLLALALAAAGFVVAFVLAEEPLGAAAAVVAAGGLPEAARLPASRSPRLLLVESVAERVVEVTFLGAIAWVALPAEPRLAGAAITALGVSYLRAYLQLRSEGLGFEVTVPAWVRLAPSSFAALGLVTGTVEIFLWTVVGFSAVVLSLEARQVERQRDAR